jgi:hypothetical protein
MLHVGIHNGDIGRGSCQGPFDASRREAAPPKALKTTHSPVAPANLADLLGGAAGESSSTKITSQLTVSSTPSNNSTSGSILSRSLRVGMTTVNSGPSVTGHSWAWPEGVKSFRRAKLTVVVLRSACIVDLWRRRGGKYWNPS